MTKYKKLIMISPEQLEKLRSDRTNTEEKNLDAEMERVLRLKNIDDDAKWALYRQVLDKFLRVTRQKREPLTIPIVPEKIEEPTPALFEYIGDTPRIAPPKFKTRKEPSPSTSFSPIRKRLRSAVPKNASPETKRNIIKLVKQWQTMKK